MLGTGFQGLVLEPLMYPIIRKWAALGWVKIGMVLGAGEGSFNAG